MPKNLLLIITRIVILSVLFKISPAIAATKGKQSKQPAKPIAPPVQETGIYKYNVTSIDGKPLAFSKYKGKVLLIVNTASKCGYTPQYHDLQELYAQYNKRGFEVLGFPSNDFANQEPGSNVEIKKFCSLNYGVKFPLFARGAVSGSDKQSLFKFLTEESSDDFKGEIKWNFEKFIIGRDGELKARFGSYINPLSTRLTKVIEEQLGPE